MTENSLVNLSLAFSVSLHAPIPIASLEDMGGKAYPAQQASLLSVPPSCLDHPAPLPVLQKPVKVSLFWTHLFPLFRPPSWVTFSICLHPCLTMVSFLFFFFHPKCGLLELLGRAVYSDIWQSASKDPKQLFITFDIYTEGKLLCLKITDRWPVMLSGPRFKNMLWALDLPQVK